MQTETPRVEMQSPKEARFSKIVLRGSLDVTVSNELLDVARRAAVAGRDAIVDGSEITRLDLSSVQILLALSRAMKGGALRIGAMSPAGQRFLDIAGVTDLLQVDPAAKAEVEAEAVSPPIPVVEDEASIEVTNQEYNESEWDLLAQEAMDTGAAGTSPDEAARAEGAPGERAGGAVEAAEEAPAPTQGDLSDSRGNQG